MQVCSVNIVPCLIWIFLFPNVHFAQDTLGKKNANTTYIKNGRYRHSDGYTRARGHVRDHKPYGEWKFEQKIQDAKGKWHWNTHVLVNYASGEMNGRYLVFEENGDTAVSGHYSRSKRVGVWMYYYPNVLNDPKEITVVRREYDSQGNNAGMWVNYFANGKVCEKWMYADSAHSYYEQYNSDGLLVMTGEYQNGLASGIWRKYAVPADSQYPAGDRLISQCDWRNGERHGVEYTYSNGAIKSEIHYDHGAYHGVMKRYSFGKLTEEQNYSNGKLNGPQRKYAPSGNVVSLLFYSNDVLKEKHVGDSLTGKILRSEWYTGSRIDSAKEWNRNGQLVFVRRMKSANPLTGEIKLYYDNGVMKDSSVYCGTAICGSSYHWYENGKVNTIDKRSEKGSCVQYDVWNEKGVHVLHCQPSRGRDTIPEIVLSETGKRLTYGTDAFDAQRNKYMPRMIEPYDESTFYIPTIVVAKKRPEHIYDNRSGEYQDVSPATGNSQAVYLELSDSIATNKRDAPDFPNGNAGLSQWFRTNIRYPEMEREAGIQGTVWLQFYVDEKGVVTDCQLLKGVSLGLDKEAERVIRVMPVWNPTTKSGKPVKSRCVMAVKFVLVE